MTDLVVQLPASTSCYLDFKTFVSRHILKKGIREEHAHNKGWILHSTGLRTVEHGALTYFVTQILKAVMHKMHEVHRELFDFVDKDIFL